MALEASAIVVDVARTIAIVRLNRPKSRNPLSISTLKQLDKTVSSLTARADLQAIIFTGAEDVFASGADIRELAQLNATSARQFSRSGQKIFQTIADARQITIAAINGYCFGGALDLALACDLRIASPNATFAHPGARLGIITGWGGTQRLPRLIGRARSLELLITAQPISSHKAWEIGLIARVAENILAEAIAIAEKKGVVSGDSTPRDNQLETRS
jgi:enoyl-CoA hydratase